MTDQALIHGGSLVLRPLTEHDAQDLQTLCCACADYFREISGLPPGPAEAQAMFTAIPPHGDYRKKRLWGVYEGERLIGVADGAFDHPRPGHFWIGLLMLEPAARRSGRGGAIVEAIETHARGEGAHMLSLAVKKDYPAAQAFWTSQGFSAVGSRAVPVGGRPVDFELMDRPLRDPAR
jgi:GNAT superfamily N-acetyltransferase